MRRKIAKVSTRQLTAHPVSEFLGTTMLMIALCVGGAMIIRGRGLFGGTFMDASQFILFLVILYSVIEPIKELSTATYRIPKGLASTVFPRAWRPWKGLTRSWSTTTPSRILRIRFP